MSRPVNAKVVPIHALAERARLLPTGCGCRRCQAQLVSVLVDLATQVAKLTSEVQTLHRRTGDHSDKGLS